MEGKAITGGGKVGKQGKFQWGSAGNVLWEELNMRDLAYLRLLAREYPNVQAASSEIINLMAIRGLPKGTEYFFSDLHGEHEAFIYLLRSSSGIIREKIRETFGHIISDLLRNGSYIWFYCIPFLSGKGTLFFKFPF